MKLASLRHGRDGRLCVVSRDLTRMLPVDNLLPTLQMALDSWAISAPKLQQISDALNKGEIGNAIAYDPDKLASPLPRAYQWCDGSAYLNHVELVRKARGAQMPPEFLHDPLMYQGGSDDFLPPTADIPVADEAYGIDMEGEVAAITDDVPMGISAKDAAGHIKLLMLVNDVSLRGLIPNELAKGFGFFHGKPSTAFSPVAVTPDELGPDWRDSKVCRPLVTHLNGKKFGEPDAGTDMQFSLADLIAHAAKTRNLRAGCIVGSGTVSNRDASKGFSCLAEIRMIETINEGKPKTPFMKFGDRVRIEMFDRDGKSIFGAIDQKVVKYTGP
ncbi:fumarylacetoacetate hydrolase family protein [uncultured Ferrovibrio sp.]|jgi:fumarylacetoacetate (FAA) hydrolase|uniref:fumarylacetoacetate hydrolase family protein n=1 Tax=uncultured Ferrovibrio sp. TaxID=1576913 RepID=UPI002601743F|nr:fumarylacetoacetate hydrolase family protein [uncultured Ferrovibrio sp.]